MRAEARRPSFEERIRRIYDHLYANAAVRTPSAIAAEVGKLLRSAAFVEGQTGRPAWPGACRGAHAVA